jgi:hypothetical protein
MNNKELKKEMIKIITPAIGKLEIELKKYIDKEIAGKMDTGTFNMFYAKIKEKLSDLWDMVRLNSDNISIFYSTLNFHRGVDKKDLKSREAQFDGCVPAKKKDDELKVTKESKITPGDLELKKPLVKSVKEAQENEEKLKQKIKNHNLFLSDTRISDCCSFSSYFDYQLPIKQQGWFCYNCFKPCKITVIAKEEEFISELFQSKCHKSGVYWILSEVKKKAGAWSEYNWRCNWCNKECDVEDKKGTTLFKKEKKDIYCLNGFKETVKDSEDIQLASYDFSDTALKDLR